MSRTLNEAKAFSFHCVGVMDEVAKTGQLVQFSRDGRAVAVRPNKLFIEVKGDDVDRSVCYQGKTLTVLNKKDNSYASTKAPDTITKMLDFVVEEYGLTLPLADVLVKDSYTSLTANVQTGRYIGLHNVGGTPCHHLAFRQEAIDWQIWIDAGKTPVPRKLVITYKNEPGHPSYSATLDEWDLSPKIPPGRFEFKAPAKAKKIEMAELLGLKEGE